MYRKVCIAYRIPTLAIGIPKIVTANDRSERTALLFSSSPLLLFSSPESD